MNSHPNIVESLLELSYQSSLNGFTKSLHQVMGCFELNGWACLFPPSFNAGGRYVVMGQGIQEKSHMLNQNILQQITQYGVNAQTESLLKHLAYELATNKESSIHIVTMNRVKRSLFILFLYRDGTTFSSEEKNTFEALGKHLDRCFVRLADDQEQEFMISFFKLTTNLYSEGLCLLDTNKQSLFDNTPFREHIYMWENGRDAIRSHTLPRQVKLPDVWKEACDEALKVYSESEFPPTSSRIAVSQGPLVRLEIPIVQSEFIEGAVRYLAFKSGLGVRPYLLLTSNLRKRSISNSITLTDLSSKASFSRREKEVGELIMEGYTASRIAEALNIALPTVKTHIRNILRKAGVRNRLELMSLCAKQ